MIAKNKSCYFDGQIFYLDTYPYTTIQTKSIHTVHKRQVNKLNIYLHYMKFTTKILLDGQTGTRRLKGRYGNMRQVIDLVQINGYLTIFRTLIDCILVSSLNVYNSFLSFLHTVFVYHLPLHSNFFGTVFCLFCLRLSLRSF